MNRLLTYNLFIFILLPAFVSAQITFTLNKTDIGCQHSYPGSAEIIVNQTNPPYTYLWNTGQTTPAISDLEHNTYTVTVTDGSGNDTSAVVIIRETKCGMGPEPFFTPNGDGYNDDWSIGNSQLFPDALILVFNRWGQKVYEHYGLYNVKWDGKDPFGIAVPDGSYYYIIYKNRNDKDEITKGSLTIIR